MKTWKKLGLAGLAAGVLAFGVQRADAACINTLDNTVDNPADCLFASGGTTGTCLLGISIDTDGSGTPPADPKKIECVDGAACDGDGAVNGSCSFRVGACVNLPNAGCSAENVTAGVIAKPALKEANDAIKRPSAVFNRRALEDALAATLPTAVEACTDADIAVKVDLKTKGGVCASPAGLACGSDLDCDDHCEPVFKKAKGKFQIEATGTSGTAKASFKLTCVPSAGAVANGAQALQVSNPADLIGGPLAIGRVGDYAIRNGQIRAVVRQPGRQHSFTLLHGGQIVDADLVRDNPADDRDGWQGMAPLVNISSTQATDTVTVENDGSDGKAAIISSSGPDDLFDTIKGDILVLSSAPLSVPASATDVDLPIDLTTRLTLTPSSNVVQVATTVTNNSGAALAYFMGDFLNPSGQLEPFGPGQGYGETLLRNGGTVASGGQPLDFLAFQGGLDSEGVTYGVIFPPTNLGTRSTQKTGTFASSGVFAWTSNTDLFNALIAPPASKPAGGFPVTANGENTLRRWFVVGKTVADVTKARVELFEQEKSALQGFVTVGGQPVAGAHVTLSNDDANWAANCPSPGECVNIYTSTLTDDHGFYRVIVPPGTYNVAARKKGAPYEGSLSTPTQAPVVLASKKTTLHDVALPQTGSVVVNVEDQAGNPVAAKVSVVGIPASPDPLNVEPYSVLATFVGRFFGFDFEEKGDVFGLADARFAGTDGTTGSFNLEPGNYNVVVSHGYEYDAYSQAITVTAGATTTVDATVNKVLDTTGFVSIDTHVHMINSPDSTVSRERRILSMIAEGVDFFVNTDHDFTHSLTDEIAAMGASSLVGNAPSIETTTSHYGHFNTWPVTVDNAQVAGGAIDWSFHLGDVNGAGYPSNGAYDLLPGEIYDAGDAYAGSQVIQVNHFNSGTLGHFNMLGIDTNAIPPTSSNDIYRCVGGTYNGYPCRVQICIDGSNDGNPCTVDANCPGGTCPAAGGQACTGGGTCTLGGNLGGYLRLDPSESNLFDDGFTALEVWIEAGRSQTALLRGDNMADWFNLLNQGMYKAGTADSDTHSSISVQAGGPRTFVASSTDDPGSIVVDEIADNVNDMRAIGSNGPFLRVSLENGSAQTASHDLADSMTVTPTGGATNSINIHVESPTWAEYDKIEVYVNSVPDCKSEWTFFGVVNPSKCNTVTPTLTLTKGVDFTVTTSTGVSGFGSRLVTDKTISGLTVGADQWVVVVVRGTDGVSHPLFPMQPQDIDDGVNATLSDLTDGGAALPWNLNEQGALALAYSNPLFFDAGGDTVCVGGASCP